MSTGDSMKPESLVDSTKQNQSQPDLILTGLMKLHAAQNIPKSPVVPPVGWAPTNPWVQTFLGPMAIPPAALAAAIQQQQQTNGQHIPASPTLHPAYFMPPPMPKGTMNGQFPSPSVAPAQTPPTNMRAFDIDQPEQDNEAQQPPQKRARVKQSGSSEDLTNSSPALGPSASTRRSGSGSGGKEPRKTTAARAVTIVEPGVAKISPGLNPRPSPRLNPSSAGASPSLVPRSPSLEPCDPTARINVPEGWSTLLSNMPKGASGDLAIKIRSHPIGQPDQSRKRHTQNQCLPYDHEYTMSLAFQSLVEPQQLSAQLALMEQTSEGLAEETNCIMQGDKMNRFVASDESGMKTNCTLSFKIANVTGDHLKSSTMFRFRISLLRSAASTLRPILQTLSSPFSLQDATKIAISDQQQSHEQHHDPLLALAHWSTATGAGGNSTETSPTSTTTLPTETGNVCQACGQGETKETENKEVISTAADADPVTLENSMEILKSVLTSSGEDRRRYVLSNVLSVLRLGDLDWLKTHVDAATERHESEKGKQMMDSTPTSPPAIPSSAQ